MCIVTSCHIFENQITVIEKQHSDHYSKTPMENYSKNKN